MLKALAALSPVTLVGCAMSPYSSVVSEEFMIASQDPGIRVHLRNKHAAQQDAFGRDRIVLFVHGATFPSETMFDIDLPGGSWMEHAAKRGFDAYIVDIRGYGRSTRPGAMSLPPEDSPPFAGADDAVRDIAAAVDFIPHRRFAALARATGAYLQVYQRGLGFSASGSSSFATFSQVCALPGSGGTPIRPF
jgi:pimeloyl-ACP methyl ester carboxylesterase